MRQLRLQVRRLRFPGDARYGYWPSDNPNPALRVAIAVAAPLVRLGARHLQA